MKADGLYTLLGKKATDNDDDEDNTPDIKISPGGIHIKDGKSKVDIDASGIKIQDNNGNPVLQIDSLKLKEMNEQGRIKDSLEKVKESIDKQLQKISSAVTLPAESDAFNGYQLQLLSPLNDLI